MFLFGRRDKEQVQHPVSQILISKRSDMPEALVEASDSVKKYLGAEQYVLYDEESLRAFIRTHFGNRVLQAFDALVPYSYKADLGRFCLVFVRGGWYADISLKVASAFHPNATTDSVLFRDIQRHSGTSWSCSTTVFFARPGAKFLQSAIEMVVHNVETEYYGITPLCPTGPTLFGQAIASQRGNSRSLYGDFFALTPNHQINNLAYVMPSGQIFAFHKQAPGGNLRKLGLQGGNNYNVLWRKRAIYAK